MAAPTGCSLVSFDATCDFGSWSPPLADADFSKSPAKVIVQNVNGEIPSNAFGGLTNADNGTTSGLRQIALLCGFSNPQYTVALLSDSFSSGLTWVQDVRISDCYNMNINDNAFAVMTGVTILTFLAGSFSSLSSTAFTGMTSLETLYFYASVPTTGVPSGLLSGLTALKRVDMSSSTMYSIPSGLFDDLKSLETLTLSDAGLTTLPSDLFHPLLSLTTLDLDTNSWVCDCNLQWLEEYLTSTGLTTTTCGSPTSLAGYDLQRSIRSLSCSTTTTTAATDSDDNWKLYVYVLIGGVSFALFIATIASICCCRNYRKLRKLNQSRDTRKGAKQRKLDVISNSSNWEQPVNSWYLPAESKRSSKPPPYVRQERATDGASTPRMFRASRVTPTGVPPYPQRVQVAERR